MTESITELQRLSADTHVVIVGGANTDVLGVPDAQLVAHDSNPGTVTVTPGGVGRNVAENLARLGVATHLITAFGSDDTARWLMAACIDAGIRTDASIAVDDVPGARYLAIFDGTRDMEVAVNDMRALERITPPALTESARFRLLFGADLVIVDTNLPEPTLRWIAENVHAPVVLETVSVAKAPRALPVLGRLAAITPNALEAGELLGRTVETLEQGRAAAAELVSRGVSRAYVTCGVRGVAWADAEDSGTLEAPAVEVANVTGAGDAFCAGVALGMLAHADARQCARVGTAIAAVALTDPRSGNHALTLAAADAALAGIA